jgi:hypothetical protein
MTYDSRGDCAYCGGPTEPLGSLGLAHYTRCIQCGAEHVEFTPPEEERTKPVYPYPLSAREKAGAVDFDDDGDDEYANKPHIARALRAIDRYGEDEG